MNGASADKVNYRFRILYALAIIFVVAGHCSGGGISFFYEWFPVYGFQVGLFVFCSGYFYHTGAADMAQLVPYIGKKLRRLLVPLYLWNAFYAVLTTFLRAAGFELGRPVTLGRLIVSPVTNGHQFDLNLGGWFVVPLAMTYITAALVRTLGMRLLAGAGDKTRETVLFLFSLPAGMLGVWLAASGFGGLWLVAERLLYFLPFFAGGILFRTVLEEKEERIPDIAYFTAVFAAKLAILFMLGEMPVCYPSWMNGFTHGVFMPFFSAALDIAFWLRVCKRLSPVLGRSRIVTALSGSTYAIMIHQFLGFLCVNTVFALIAAHTGHFGNFDWNRYHQDVWYFYLPKDLDQMKILFLAAGLGLPVCVQRAVSAAGRCLHDFYHRAAARR